MAYSKSLFLYEEIMLLALRNEKGTIATGFSEFAVAGAVLAELLLDHRISTDGSRKQTVELRNTRLTGDPIIDECIQKMIASKKRASLQTWVTRLAGIKNLRHKVARQLCTRGILRADEDKILLFFTRKIYPEINPRPEKELIARMHKAIFTESNRPDPRTIVLISLANSAGLLTETFGRKELRARKKRIEQTVNGEIAGAATKEVIAACQAAVMIATMVPIITSN